MLVSSVSFGRHSIRVGATGIPQLYVNPTTSLRAIDTLNHIITAMPSASGTILEDSLHQRAHRFFTNLCSAFGLDVSAVYHAQSAHSSLFVQLLDLAGNPIYAKSPHLLHQYMSLVAQVSKYLVSQQTSLESVATASSAPLITPAANPVVSDSPANPIVAPAPALTDPPAPSTDAAKKEPPKAPRTPVIDADILHRLLENQTSDVLPIDSFKHGLVVLSTLGRDRHNAERIADTLHKLIMKHSDTLRQQIALMREEIHKHVAQQPLATADMPVDEDDAAVDEVRVLVERQFRLLSRQNFRQKILFY
jgi:hypothetical protein